MDNERVLGPPLSTVFVQIQTNCLIIVNGAPVYTMTDEQA